MKQIDGFWVPDTGDACYQWTLAEIGIPALLVDAARSIGKKPTNIVHAGGNTGMYAIEFAKRCSTVYTFEPSHENFQAMSLNCMPYSNIFMFRAALGPSPGSIQVVNDEPHNTGTWRVGSNTGDIPMIRIDDLGLVDVDIIHLDVEGFELPAIQGAVNTIKSYYPVLAFESLNHNVAYNYTQEELFDFVCSLGYNAYQVYSNEVMFIRR